jgi:Immunity protein 50
MKPYQTIDGYEQVIAVFGLWPSFHDGEVHRIVLDRMSRTSSGAYIPTIELHVRCWTMSPVLTDGFQFQLEHDSVVRFLFEDVFNLEIEGFGQQNVLSSLKFSTTKDPEGSKQYLHVELEHCYVFSGEFSTRRARILGIEPYVKPVDG